MSDIKVGDKVRRKTEQQSAVWIGACNVRNIKPYSDVTVSYVADDVISFAEVQGTWLAGNYHVVSEESTNKIDMVTQPKHYEFFEGVEAITIIARSMTEKQFAGYCMGNALKYRLRAGKKFNTEEDLNKADYYKELFQKHRHECIDEDI